MSVIINGFNMPDTCEKCLFAKWSNVYQTSSCKLVPPGEMCFEMYSVEYRSKRSDICPLTTIHPELSKMGKWVKVHGWATPGGDPVWACSECGKGLHVYGIEHGTYGSDVADGQWVACPNCGAYMGGNDEGD